MAAMRILFLFLVTVAALVVGGCMAHGDGVGPSYSYKPGSPDGPENWGKLSPEYKLCGEGRKQSPIDIITMSAIPNPQLDNLTRVYQDTLAVLHNSGQDIFMTFLTHDVGTITINYHNVPKKLGLQKIHWHSPSEHTINGERFPLEVHLVHANPEGYIAVIGILYRIGDADSFYDMIEDKLEKLRTSPQEYTGMVSLRSMEKRTGSYFRYMGSLTTPPCTENVIWNILGKVRYISAEQLQLLTAPLPAKDNRPPQPLNGRTVYFYHPPNSTISFNTTS